jgi:hypothetical protein
VLYLQASRRGAREEADAVRALADRRNIEIIAVVCAPRARRHRAAAPPERREAALGDALALIAQGRAQVLLCPRLEALAAGLRELVALIEWLEAAGADLVVLDVDLDTASSAGRGTARVLGELVRLQREPPHGRGGPGRPGLAARAPELASRIVAMRARGLSMQAIADALNAAGVPTSRGGAQWRPSSVQAALGYRRPHPPLPGVPPTPPAPPAPPARAPAAPVLPGAPSPRAPHRVPGGPRVPRPSPASRSRDAGRGPGGSGVRKP